MSFCYAITSGKGGTGKSTVAAGLGLTFSQKGYKTLLIDMDEGLRCLDLMLGVEKDVVFDLADILDGRDAEDGTYKISGSDNLYLIPAPRNPDSINADAFCSFASDIVSKYDVVIIDFPAGSDFSLYKYLPQKTVVLAVCNPDPVSVRDAASVCELLAFPPSHTKLIVNKFVYKHILKGLYGNIDDIIDNSGFQLVGVIPNDEELSYFSVKHKIKRNGRAQAAFKRIVNRLCGKYELLPNPKKI